MTDQDRSSTSLEGMSTPREADDLFQRVKSIEEKIEALNVERDALAEDDFAAKLDYRERLRDLELRLSELRSQAHDLTGEVTG